MNKSSDYGAVSKGGPLGGQRPREWRKSPSKGLRWPCVELAERTWSRLNPRSETATTRNSHRAFSITQVLSVT